jgi:hypothetical protein
VSANGDCALDSECISQRCTVAAPCSSACCAGTCNGGTPPRRGIAIGDACDTGSCVAGAYCNSLGTCSLLKANGEACNADYECGYGLACSVTTGICGVLPTVGEPCPDDRCRDFGTHCGVSGTCVHDGLPGDPCAVTTDCASLAFRGVVTTPPAHFICDATSHCALGPELGAMCSGAAPCFDDGTFCGSSSTCTPLLDDGTTCAANGDCASSYCNTNLPGPTTCLPRDCF